jgi:hypothetical protein
VAADAYRKVGSAAITILRKILDPCWQAKMPPEAHVSGFLPKADIWYQTRRGGLVTRLIEGSLRRKQTSSS